MTMDQQVAEHFAHDMNAPDRIVDRTFAPSISYNMTLLHSVQAVITPEVSGEIIELLV